MHVDAVVMDVSFANGLADSKHVELKYHKTSIVPLNHETD